MSTARKTSDDVFYPSQPELRRDTQRSRKKKVEARQSTPIWTRKRSTEKESPKKKKKKSWSRESAARKFSEAIPAALKSPTTILRRKKPLGPSLSWDPEHRSHSPSQLARSRIHSDGSEEPERSGESEDEHLEGPRFELELSCPHCALVADYRRRLLKTELESAVLRLARRLGNRNHLRDETRNMQHTPDIIVSSISSDEEDRCMDRHTSSERGTSIQTSETSTACSSASPSPHVLRNGNDVTLEFSPETTSSSQDLFPPSPIRLRPPSLLSPYPDSASPPRSNSIDLSTLRRDIELLSVSSGESDAASESEFEPPTPAESVRTVRSKSHDPSAPTSILRRPSRIEHLSELFRFTSMFRRTF